MIYERVTLLGRWCLNLLTEADNKTPSAFRVAALIVTAHMCGLQYVDTVITNHPFMANDFGMGIAAVWAAAGIGERIAHYHSGGQG
jgi:hypothetical protein